MRVGTFDTALAEHLTRMEAKNLLFPRSNRLTTIATMIRIAAAIGVVLLIVAAAVNLLRSRHCITVVAQIGSLRGHLIVVRDCSRSRWRRSLCLLACVLILELLQLFRFGDGINLPALHETVLVHRDISLAREFVVSCHIFSLFCWIKRDNPNTIPDHAVIPR